LPNEALSDSPVVLFHGLWQRGKTTLACTLAEPAGYTYLTFDDDVVRSAAATDPSGFALDLPPKTILDEIQRVPDLFTSLKMVIDRDRPPGRFIVTGSTNVLLLPKLADSQAGRMEILRLRPLAQAELLGHRSNFLERLFADQVPLTRSERLGPELADRIVAGGFPAALSRATPRRRLAWHRDYIETLAQRDVRQLAHITSLDVMPRLLAAAATQTAQLFNTSALAAPFELSRPTTRDYLTLLERIFLIELLPAWHVNALNRLVKTPKIHIGDTGVACVLLGVDATSLRANRTLFGHVLETFVHQELRAMATWHDEPLTFSHLRDRDGVEVDLVIEAGARALIGVEAKAGATVTPTDFSGLRHLRDRTSERFACGVVLYEGETTVGFGDRLHAVPLRRMWEGF
jgi:predicted AAA+ superfamily ATPase